MTKRKQEFEKECLRIEEDTIHNAKALFNLSHAWELVYYSIGLPTAVLAATASVIAFSSCKWCTSLMAIMVAISTAVTTFLNPSAKSNSCKAVANEYNKLNKELRLFCNIELKAMNDDEASKRIKDYLLKYNKLSEKIPNIPQWARKKAKEGIELGEANYKVDNNQ